jgi:hypothetical protein
MPVFIEQYVVVGSDKEKTEAAEMWRFSPKAWKLSSTVAAICERPRSFLVQAAAPNFIVGETKTVTPDSSPPTAAPNDIKGTAQSELLKQIKIASPNWEGKQLQVAIGRVTESGQTDDSRVFCAQQCGRRC